MRKPGAFKRRVSVKNLFCRLFLASFLGCFGCFGCFDYGFCLFFAASLFGAFFLFRFGSGFFVEFLKSLVKSLVAGIFKGFVAFRAEIESAASVFAELFALDPFEYV